MDQFYETSLQLAKALSMEEEQMTTLVQQQHDFG
jgi:hypothetical protein